MSLLEFADHWIAKNVPVTTIYGNTIKRRVKALVLVFDRQGNDEKAGLAIVSYFVQLVDDYYKEQEK